MNQILERIDNTVDNIIEKINLNDAIEKDEQIIENELMHLVNYIQKSDTSDQTSWFFPQKPVVRTTATEPDGTVKKFISAHPSLMGLWNGLYERIPKKDIAERYKWLCILLPKCPAYVIRMIIEDSPDNPQYVTVTADEKGLLVEIG